MSSLDDKKIEFTLPSCISLASEPSRILMADNYGNPNLLNMTETERLWGAIGDIQETLLHLSDQIATLNVRNNNQRENRQNENLHARNQEVVIHREESYRMMKAKFPILAEIWTSILPRLDLGSRSIL